MITPEECKKLKSIAFNTALLESLTEQEKIIYDRILLYISDKIEEFVSDINKTTIYLEKGKIVPYTLNRESDMRIMWLRDYTLSEYGWEITQPPYSIQLTPIKGFNEHIPKKL